MNNMQCKFLEIRDEGTRIEALAMKFGTLTEAERWIASTGGWGRFDADREWYVFLFDIQGGVRAGHSDPYDWVGNSTMHAAHLALRDGGWWDKVESGGVLDIRCTVPKDDPRYQEEPVLSDRFWRAGA
jgi:hypothetical protein